MKLQYLILLVLGVHNTISVILMRVSRTSETEYSASVAVLMDELIKLVFCFFMLVIAAYKGYGETAGNGGTISAFYSFMKDKVFVFRTFIHLAVPAICFAVQKNLLFVAISNLDVAVFQIVYQGKILTTALFSVLIMGTQLNKKQIGALLVLLLGVALVQFDLSRNGETGGSSNNDNTNNESMGLLAVVGACFTSGFASVYFEWVLKRIRTSSNGDQEPPWYDIWIKNLQLAILTIIPAAVPIVAKNEDLSNLFKGFNALVWVVILSQSCGGILVALVIKYADNVLKNFSTSLAIVCSVLVSAIFLGFKVTPGFTAGTCLVLLSVFLYVGNSSTERNQIPPDLIKIVEASAIKPLNIIRGSE